MVDLVKAICALAMFPKLTPEKKAILISAVDHFEVMALRHDLNVHCVFEQDVSGETCIKLRFTYGSQHAKN